MKYHLHDTSKIEDNDECSWNWKHDSQLINVTVIDKITAKHLMQECQHIQCQHTDYFGPHLLH